MSITNNNNLIKNCISLVQTMDEVDWKVADEKIRTELKAAQEEIDSHITYSNNNFGNAFKGETFGQIPVVEDAAPIDSALKVSIASKNLIPYPYHKGSSYTSNGITFTVANGVISMSGTATALAIYQIVEGYSIMSNRLSFPYLTTLSFEDRSDTPSSTDYYLECYKQLGSTGAIVSSTVFSGGKASIAAGDTIIYVYLIVKAGATVNAAIAPMLERGPNSGTFIPYINLTEVSKNLLPYPYSYSTYSANNVTFIDEGNSCITVTSDTDSGGEIKPTSANTYYYFNVNQSPKFELEPGEYTFYIGSSSIRYGLAIKNPETGSLRYPQNTGTSFFNFSIEEGEIITQVFLIAEAGRTYDAVSVQPQIEKGSAATSWVPYRNPYVYRYSRNMFWVPDTEFTYSGGGTMRTSNGSHFEIEFKGTSVGYNYAEGDAHLNWTYLLPPGTYNFYSHNFTTTDTTSGQFGSLYARVVRKSDLSSLATINLKWVNTNVSFTLDNWTEVYFDLSGYAANGVDIYVTTDLSLVRTDIFDSTDWSQSAQYQVGKVNDEWEVEGLTSGGAEFFLIGPDASGDESVINVEYNKDVNVVFEELTNAIISLGGNV